MLYCHYKLRGGLQMNIDEAVVFLGCSKRTVYRYVKDGSLPYRMKGKEKTFKKRDLSPILVKLIENRDKHRPDVGEPTGKVVETQKIKALIKETPTKTLLNEHGEIVLLETTKLLKDNNLLDGIERSVILRYAIAVQMKEKFMSKAVHGFEDKFYFDIAKQFTQEVQYYEKELGLTPKAFLTLKRLKGEKTEDTTLDPMEELLNS